MSEIIRKIGDVELMVETESANELYFEQSFIEKNNIIDKNLSPADICNYIASDTYLPLLLNWELLDKCNFSCPFCYITGHSHNKIISFEEMKPHIKELINKGLLYCTLTGGEILLHKDFKKIYTFLKKQGVLIELYTNAYFIDNEIINLFKKYPPYKIEISIYGISQNRFNTVTATKKGSYRKVLDNILELKSNGFNVKCKTPINKLTKPDFFNVKNWCKKHNIDYYFSSAVSDAYDGSSLQNFSLSLDDEMSFESLRIRENEEKQDFIDKKNIISEKRCYSCGVKNYSLHINSAFELNSCAESDIKETSSNILDTGINKALKKYRDFINKHLEKAIIGCSSCEVVEFCKMCPIYAKKITDKNNKIIDFKVPVNYCEKMKMKANLLFEKI